jgi:proton-translocating NADH-quinone oxidoreductase chain N
VSAPDVTALDLFALTPLGIVVLTAILLLLYEVFTTQADRTFCAHIAVVGGLLALFFALRMLDDPPRALFGAPGREPIMADAFATFSSILMIIAGMIASLLSPAYVRNARAANGEYYALIWFSVAGMMVMAMAGDLITFFLGLETMSIAVYALTGSRGNDPRASEAALKYFLMGSFATGFLLFGIALIYGATGSVTLLDLAGAVSIDDAIQTQPLLGLGLVLVLTGFAFKIAAVPFHMWAPDVYEGAPTPVTGFMAVGVKAAAFVGLLRIVIVGLRVNHDLADPIWVTLLSGLAVATVIGGNLLALVQQNVKRMLAYSSISHAGYALIGVVAAARGEPSGCLGALLSERLHLHDARRLRRIDLPLARRRRQRSGALRRLCRHRLQAPRARRRDVGVHDRARRDPADRRLLRQALSVLGRDPRRRHLAGDRRHHRLGAERLLLPARDRRLLHEGRSRSRSAADRDPLDPARDRPGDRGDRGALYRHLPDRLGGDGQDRDLVAGLRLSASSGRTSLRSIPPPTR